MDAMTSTDAEGSMAVANFGAAEIFRGLGVLQRASALRRKRLLVAADNSSSCCTLTGLKASLSKLKASPSRRAQGVLEGYGITPCLSPSGTLQRSC